MRARFRSGLPRDRILAAIEDGCFTLPDIGRKTRLESLTIREELQALIRAGLVEKRRGHGGGQNHHPYLYVLPDTPLPESMPIRRYESSTYAAMRAFQDLMSDSLEG